MSTVQPAMDLTEVIRLRRSIKPEAMRSDPVDHALIEKMLEAARWAPTHGLTEPWRFVVFEGEARKALAEAILTTMIEDGEPPIPEGDARRTSLYDKMLKPPFVLAIICSPSTSPKIVEHEEIISTAIAVQNMMLVAREAGVATYWTSGKKAFHKKMAEFLGISAPARCLGFMYVGHVDRWPEGVRKPIAEKVQWRR